MEKRAADPAVRQRAATHTAAEAEGSTEKARAEEAAAAAADAEAAGEAAWPGPKCSKYHEPTKGHTTGRPGPQCTALLSPERARGSFHTAVEVEEAYQVKEDWPPLEAFRLMLNCDNNKHDAYCCSMPEKMDQAPSPLPAKVYHPHI
jgi:hypothetical protein